MKRWIGLFALLTALVVSLASVSAQAEDGAWRFVHAVPGVGAVDISIDGSPTVINLNYGEASSYINLSAGTYEVVVRPAGLTTELWRQQISASAGLAETLVASSLDPLAFQKFEDDFTELAPGITRFRLVHAIDGAPPVTISSDGQTVISDLAYGSATGGFDLEANVYPFTIALPDSTELLTDAPFAFASSTAHMVIVYGTPALPEVMVLTAPTAAEENSGFVRIAHTVSDAPAVDVYANETLLIPALAFGQTTEHLALPAGDYTLELRASGTSDSLLSTDATIETGAAVTVAAVGTADDLALNILPDDISGVDAETAVVSVLNTIPDAVASVTLFDGTALAQDLAFGEAALPVALTAQSDVGTLSLTVGGQSQDIPLPIIDLYGGVYYNAIILLDTSGAFPQPTVRFEPTALALVPGSAPGAAPAIAAEPTPAAVAPTAAPVVEPTQAPQVAPTVPPPPPTEAPVVTTPEPEGPTASVNLSPGANLQLRQFPSADALSLGLAPSGTVLTINGREGADVDIDGNVTELDFVDPATALAEDEDLVPAETWLNVTYETPDGGQITAWINAQFVIVRDPQGRLLELKLLPLIPGNLAGEAQDTAITPPPVPEPRVVARVVGLNPGVNLNIRRTPDTQGEVLMGMPNGSIAEIEGLDESREWAFVIYGPPEGGSVTGWISTRFIDYELDGTRTTLEILEQRDLIEIIEPERRGAISADAPARSTPAPDITRDAFVATVELNPGANLNLRRTPDAQSEVLVQIPSQTRVIVVARTEDELWLRTSYENQEGWIAAQFVSLTFNGAVAEITDIPVEAQGGNG